jgi:hypothetical protein
MSKLCAGVLLACVLAIGAGCQSNKAGKDKAHCKDAAKADCAKCEGHKAACDAKKTGAATGDVCSHCPGDQAAAADGTCPVCHAKPQ